MIIKYINKNQKYRKLYKKTEINKLILKYINLNNKIPKNIRWKAMLQLNVVSKNNTIVKIHNLCIFSGRKNIVSKNFKINRMKFKQYASEGLLTGITKSSW